MWDHMFYLLQCDGLWHGFRIGYTRSSLLKSASANMESASQHPDIIPKYLQNELSLDRMLDPFKETDDLPSLQVNPFGVIPEGHNSGKWRLITDLSYPPGQSINDGIDPALCSTSLVVDAWEPKLSSEWQHWIDIDVAFPPHG